MDIMREITDILDKHCTGCPVKSTITKYHGQGAQDRYCNDICKVGKKITQLGIKIDYGVIPDRGQKLDKDTYRKEKKKGRSDKQIGEMYGIARTTLCSRKKHWGIDKFKSRLESMGKTKQDYLDLKVLDYTDREVSEAWGVGENTLLKWKRKQGIRGGL